MAGGHERGVQELSPVDAAVLALAIEQPSHGYELWQRFDERFGTLLPVGSSRVYKAVWRLVDQGLLEPFDREDDAAMPAGRTRSMRGPCQRATAAGVHTHRTWLIADLHNDPIGHELHRRLLAMTAPSTGVLRRIVEQYERSAIDAMRQLPTAPEVRAGSRREQMQMLCQQLLIEEQRLILDARLRWAASASRRIEALADGLDHR